MAIQQIPEGFMYARNAGEDLSAAINKIAHVDTDGDIVLAGAGDHVIGVIYEGAAADTPCTVQMAGIAKVILGSGGITAGALVKPDASGLGVNAGSAGDKAIGIALQTGLITEVVSVALIQITVHS